MDYPCRLSLLGADVDAVTADDVLDFVSERALAGRSGLVTNHNLHSLYLFGRRPELRSLYARADIIEIDSTPLIAWGKLMGLGLNRVHRCTYLDWREDFWARAQAEKWRVCHIGGRPEDSEPARAAILKRYPRVQLDVHHGYFDMNGPANEALLFDLHLAGPQVLLVGMGMPRQEIWVHNNIERLPPCVVLTVGGAFDYEAGSQYEPPRWSGRWGIEWLMRFLHDPRRLFERYFIEPWALMPAMLGDVARRLTGKIVAVPRPDLKLGLKPHVEAAPAVTTPAAVPAQRRA